MLWFVGAIPGAVVGATAGVLTDRTLRNRAKRTAGFRTSMLTISTAEAARLSLPAGHPREGNAYVGHPLIPERYFVMADFHAKLFEHKVAELQRVLAALGAVEAHVHVADGWSQSRSVDAGVDFVGAGMSSDSARLRDILFTVMAPDNRGTNWPEDLVWFHEEEMWQAVAQQRIDTNLAATELRLTYSDDYGITAGVADELGLLGFSVGGSFAEKRNTSWIVRVRFGDNCD